MNTLVLSSGLHTESVLEKGKSFSSIPTLASPISMTEQKEKFIATIHQLFYANLEQRKNSSVERWKRIWKEHAFVRTAVGITLAGGAVAATASGAGAVAAGFVATRAVMGAIGGYMMTEGLFDSFGPKLRSRELDVLLSKIETAQTIEELDPYIQKALGQIELDHFENEITKSQSRNNRFNTVKKIVATTACAVFALIGGSRIAEAATASLEPAAIHSPFVSRWDAPIPGVMHVTPSISAPAHIPTSVISHISAKEINTIMDDVKSDHPTQNCITLEQCVRRIEGLKQGIPLSESTRLNALNTEACRLTRDPNGYVVKAMKQLHYLKDWESVDDIAPHLKREDIGAILNKACEEMNPNPSISGISKTTSAAVTSVTPVISAPTVPSTTGSGWLYGALGGIGATLGIGYVLRSKLHNAPVRRETEEANQTPVREESEETLPTPESPVVPINPAPPEPITSQESSSPIPEKSKVSDSLKPSTQETNTTPLPANNTDFFANPQESRNNTSLVKITQEIQSLPERERGVILNQLEECPDEARDRMARLNAAVYAFQVKLGFTSPKMEVNSEVYGNVSYTLSTIGGSYKIHFIQEKNRAIGIWFQWFDHNEIGYQNGKRFSKVALSDMAAFSREITEVSEDLFMEAIVSREIKKQEEFREVHTFEITHNDLQAIYNQCENKTHTFGTENETGGHWFQGIYRLKNGVLRFQNLNNPKTDELKVTRTSFAIKSEKIGEWLERWYQGFEIISPSEEKVMKKIQDMNGGRFGSNIAAFSGYYNFLNWHKHPDGPYEPSGLDIRQANENDFLNNPSRSTWTWGIANVAPKIMPNPPENTLYLRAHEFGGKRDYMITFWKLRRGDKNTIPVKITKV